METDFLDKAQGMSQRLEPGEIFHNDILVLVKYPKSFPPCKTIPRGGQGWKPAWVCAYTHGGGAVLQKARAWG